MSMKNALARIVARDETKPTLRERAAALKAAAARIMRRAPVSAEADQGRRAIMKGSMAAAVVIPLPAFATSTPVAAGPHPDQALIDAEAECLRADAAHDAAREASREAWRAAQDALGPCPADLVMLPWEKDAFSKFYSRSFVRRLRTRMVPRNEQPGDPDHAWTAEALKAAIALAPNAFGPAGRTPHHIRRWRGLLPVAEAYDAHDEALSQRFRSKELFAEERAADQARSASFVAVGALTATTLDGLAIKARHCDIPSWRKMSPNWASLLASAAAITGVTLCQPDPDEA